MLPAQLSAANFAGYPPQARKLAQQNIALLQHSPLGFVPFLLKEIMAYDYKFPAEKHELEGQLAYLSGLSAAERQREMAGFARLQLTPKLENFDWVNSPGQFLEQLSAHLWASHQMDEFRESSERYIHNFYASLPAAPLPLPRLGIVVIGQGVGDNNYSLFRKLRRRGVHFSKVNPANGLNTIIEAIQARTANHPVPYGHWYIDGGALAREMPGFTCVSYDRLAPIRGALAEKMRAAFESPHFDPELLRTTLAAISPESVGMKTVSGDPTLDRFQLSLLTEGSGTQVYSTTFVQWAAREALRRAQPVTLFARYAPRQRERSMNELLTGTQGRAATDPHGSLIDADMGAYYTFLNLQRLNGSDRSTFLVWFEDHTEGVAIGPNLPPGTEDSTSIGMSELLRRVV